MYNESNFIGDLITYIPGKTQSTNNQKADVKTHGTCYTFKTFKEETFFLDMSRLWTN